MALCQFICLCFPDIGYLDISYFRDSEFCIMKGGDVVYNLVPRVLSLLRESRERTLGTRLCSVVTVTFTSRDVRKQCALARESAILLIESLCS